MKVRRAHVCMLSMHDDQFLDVLALTKGEISISSRPQAVGLAIHDSKEVRLDRDMLDVLHCVRADQWHSVDDLVGNDELSDEAIEKLVACGLLISDSSDAAETAMRTADEAIRNSEWHQVAALYHKMSAWLDFRPPDSDEADAPDLHEYLVRESERSIERRVEQAGQPPEHFHSRTPLSEGIALDRPARDGDLYDLLLKRKSTRTFDLESDLPLDQLNTLLYYVFGCHGTFRLAPDFVSLKKTSASGGAMHPAEVYPLVSRVDGLEAGLYHYRSKDHCLELLKPMTPDQASDLTVELSANQEYFGTANVCLLLTYRFARHNFKYPKHAKSYKVAMMDTAHLSQTAYLVCSELGIGACFYGAVNDRNINNELGLDGITEGAIAAIACGVPDPAGDDQEFRCDSYDPIAAQDRNLA